jgi:hypothetical protein
MASILTTWKNTVYDQLVAWRLRLDRAKPTSVYAALSASALWPLFQAVHSEGIVPVTTALAIAAGVGGNLIAEQIQRWHDQADPPTESDIETWIATHVQTNAELRQALDAILEHVDAIPQAQADINETDQQWFIQTLRAELQALGNLPRFEAHLSGSGAIVQGQGSAGAGKGGVAVVGDVNAPITITNTSGPVPPEGLRTAYLTWVTEQVRDLPLSGIDPNTIQEDSRRHLDLASVYTALMTQRAEGGTARDMHPDRETKRLSALAVLNTESRLALLGDPGSGKSAFVNFVALCMAGELLGRPDANLAILTTPVPEDEQERRSRDDSPPEPQPWDRGPLLPIRVILRGAAPQLLGKPKSPAPTRRHLRSHPAQSGGVVACRSGSDTANAQSSSI